MEKVFLTNNPHREGASEIDELDPVAWPVYANLVRLSRFLHIREL